MRDLAANTKGESFPDALVNPQLQRYGQYAEQFWDYNANRDNDGGDQNGDGDIR